MISESNNKPILIFDLGNVMVQLTSIDKLWPDLASNQSQAEKLEQRWAESSAVKAYESGQINDFFEFYSKLQQDLVLNLDWVDFQIVYNQIIGPLYPETIPLLKNLTGTCPLYLLSNTSPSHWNYVKHQDNLSSYFKKCYLSYELGVMKPEPLIFEKVIHDIPSVPQNMYFFDDRRENVETAARIGMNAYEVTGGLPLVRLLSKMKFL